MEPDGSIVKVCGVCVCGGGGQGVSRGGEEEARRAEGKWG